MSLLQTVREYLGQSEINQISDHLGVDPQTTESAVAAALPMIVGGMARHAASPEGAATVQEAAATHEDAADDVHATVQAAPAVESGGLLNKIFGSHKPSVQDGVQQASGLGLDKAKQLLSMLAPLVLSAFARRQNSNQLSGNTGADLRQEAQSARDRMPNVGGFLGQILGA